MLGYNKARFGGGTLTVLVFYRLVVKLVKTLERPRPKRFRALREQDCRFVPKFHSFSRLHKHELLAKSQWLFVGGGLSSGGQHGFASVHSCHYPRSSR